MFAIHFVVPNHENHLLDSAENRKIFYGQITKTGDVRPFRVVDAYK
jgi:hypothetical protein